MAKSKKSKKKKPSAPVVLIVAGVAGGALILFCVVGMALLLPAIQQAREAARRAQARNGNPSDAPIPAASPTAPANSGTGTMAPVTGQTRALLDPETEKAGKLQLALRHLQQIGLASHNFHDVNQHFPPLEPAGMPKPGEIPQSWLTDLLPYMDQQRLYASIKRSADWTDRSQGNAFKTVVPNYLNPAAEFTNNQAGYTRQSFRGEFTGRFGRQVFGSARHSRRFVEHDAGRNGHRRIPRLGRSRELPRRGERLRRRAAGVRRPHDGVALVLFVDGSVHQIKNTVSADVCRKLADPADGQALD